MVGELGGGGGFAGAVYSYHDDDVREAVCAWLDGRDVFREDAADVILGGGYDVFCCDFTA